MRRGGWPTTGGSTAPKLVTVLARINTYLVRWIRNKYRRLDRIRAAHRKLAELAAGQPRLFRHWAWVTSAWR